MTESKTDTESTWIDPDDAPEWTDEMFEEAEFSIGGRVIKPGAWRKIGRPPVGEQAKTQVTLRLDPDVIARFKAGGPGWQTRINAALRQAVGLS